MEQYSTQSAGPPTGCRNTANTSFRGQKVKHLSTVLITCTALLASDLATADVLLPNVTLIDVETGTLAEGHSVLIENDRIAEIGSGLTAPDGTPLIDGGGAYLIPGLWDSHVHIFSSPTEPDSALPGGV